MELFGIEEHKNCILSYSLPTRVPKIVEDKKISWTATCQHIY